MQGESQRNTWKKKKIIYTHAQHLLRCSFAQRKCDVPSLEEPVRKWPQIFWANLTLRCLLKLIGFRIGPRDLPRSMWTGVNLVWRTDFAVLINCSKPQCPLLKFKICRGALYWSYPKLRWGCRTITLCLCLRKRWSRCIPLGTSARF